MEFWRASFLDQAGLIQGLSLLEAGNMSFKLGDPSETEENRRRFFEDFRIDPARTVGLRAVHGANVLRLTTNHLSLTTGSYDAAYTFEPGVVLFGTFADCLPIFFFSPKPRVVGLAHAGWRGILAGIVPNTIGALSSGGIDPDELFVSVGPHIQKRCFEVGKEVAELFRGRNSPRPRVLEEKAKAMIDLKGIVFDQLISAGVLLDHIHLSDQCTHCEEIFFSNRRDKQKGAMLAFIGLSAGGFGGGGGW